MLEKKTTNQDLTSWRGRIPLSNLYTVGIAGEEFLRALRDKGQFLGSRCNACDQTYVPMRQFCERCFAELKESVKVADRGVVVSWTRTHVDLDGRRLEKPVTMAAVRLDGATTVIVHRFSGTPSIGQKAKAIFEPKGKRKGSILDVKHFEPV
ncbi:MAG: Zn-ribbon domain-containing OB-fold protein [Planctomycetes bacterium]|nr:Zn-ribbon domain-containing OB-fold protein [Planctomycetota bacterium]